MFLNKFRRLLPLLALLFIISPTGWAETTGKILGTVTDSSGAAIPAATVTATAIDTGQFTEVIADARGNYSVLALQPGRYNLRVSKDGFKTVEQVGITIDVNSALEINIVLQVGQVTTAVVIQADTVSVETSNTQLGDVIGGKSIETLPLNGRSYTNLLGLQSGVVPVSAGTLNPKQPYGGSAETGNLSINGQREDANGFLVNGGSVEEARNNGASAIPNLDSIAEFRVLTSSIDAQYGHYSGGLISVITKSGTNKLHGNIFEFLRNTDLDAANYYSPNRGVFRQNQFGGTLGGPVISNKLFFFVDYQGTRTAEGLSSGEVTVVTPAQAGGDFSSASSTLTGTVNGFYFANTLTQRLGYTVTSGENYYSPGCTSNSQCVFPNATIPQSAFSSVAKGLLPFIPQTASGVFASSANNETINDNKGGIRIDFNSKRLGTISVYYFIDSFAETLPFGSNPVPGFPTLNTQHPQTINISDIKTFNANTVNEFRFALTRYVSSSNQPSLDSASTLASLGFNVSGPGSIVPANPLYNSVPLVNFNNFSIGQPGLVYQQFETPPQWFDNFSKVIGSHLLKAGVEIDHINFHQRFPSVSSNGNFTFAGTETGVDFADFLIGAPTGFVQESPLDYDNIQNYLGIYGQDSWQARPGLTINYGLRWDRIPNWYETHNETSDTFIIGEQSTVYPTAPLGLVFAGDPRPGGGKIPRTVSNTSWKDFAPRVGIAYTRDGGTSSIRASYGLFYMNVNGAQAEAITGAPPFAEYYQSPAPDFLESPYLDRTDGIVRQSPFPFTPAVPGSTTFDFSAFLPLSGFPSWSVNNRAPYTADYSVTLQRQIGSGAIASIGYVGSQTHALIDPLEVNPGNAALCLSLSQPSQVAPGSLTCGPQGENTIYTRANGTVVNGTRAPFGAHYGSNILFASVGNSNYSSLQTSLRYRSGPFSVLAAYTWSKSLDDSSESRDNVLNPYNHKLSRELSAFSVPRSFVINYDYNLPFGSPTPRKYEVLISGWQLAGITRFSSGLPVTLSEVDDRSLIGENTYQLDTPDYNSSFGLQLNKNPRTGLRYFNVSSFDKEPLGSLGNARRRFFTGPGIDNYDVSLSKGTHLTERMNLEFRAEFFNVFNHAQFGDPNGNVNSSAFGEVTTANDPRIGQVALKLNF